MRKAALHNLGCKVNAYETEAMQQLLEEAGFEIVPFTEEADVYVINTCSVTNIADRKSRQMLHKARKMNENAIVVATGCYVQTDAENVVKDLSIDIILGNNKKSQLVELVEKALQEKEMRRNSQALVPSIIDINDGTVSYENLHIKRTAEHTRAFIKVQDGCNQFCSYCIIPYARGRVRSREIDDVVKEITGLAATGYKEVVLTGIHLSSYGQGMGYGLIDLIEAVNAIDGIERIRLGSLEPQIITDEFCRRLEKTEKICPHFHLSLQSGCDTVLKRMNRKYTAEEYKEGCKRLRQIFHNPAITTDVIVGFPGETDAEFQKTLAFLKDIHFYEMHIFKYSRRKGTRADLMPDQIADQVKAERSDILLELADQMSLEYREQLLGQELDVLMEEELQLDGRRYFVGHTKNYVKVAMETEKDMHNQIVSGRADSLLRDDIVLIK